MKKKEATSNEELEAFQKYCPDFIKKIEDPEVLVWKLYFKNLVSRKQVDEVSKVGLSTVQRSMKLLSVFGDQITVNPAKLKDLLLVLRKHPPLKDIVDKLKSTYRNNLKVGNRGSGLKGLSDCNVKFSISLCDTSFT